ncbi:MAG: methyltransferase [Candidatus Nanoarchaeia archaeon]
MTEHYFTEKPTSTLTFYNHVAILRNKEISFITGSGLFSFKKIDRGTRLLIDTCLLEKNWKVLDLGCGYGIIGVSLKLLEPSIDVTFSDINERALLLTNKNLRLHNLNGTLIQSNGFEKIKDTFNTILLNPPQTAGKKLCFQLIIDSKDHLEKKGTLQVVARHNKGGKELSKKMQEIFGHVKEISKGSGYRVYVSQK